MIIIYLIFQSQSLLASPCAPRCFLWWDTRRCKATIWYPNKNSVRLITNASMISVSKRWKLILECLRRLQLILKHFVESPRNETFENYAQYFCFDEAQFKIQENAFYITTSKKSSPTSNTISKCCLELFVLLAHAPLQDNNISFIKTAFKPRNKWSLRTQVFIKFCATTGAGVESSDLELWAMTHWWTFAIRMKALNELNFIDFERSVDCKINLNVDSGSNCKQLQVHMILMNWLRAKSNQKEFN